MMKLFDSNLIEKPLRPYVYAYYDRADMQKTTPENEFSHRHNVYEIMYVAKGKTVVYVDEDNNKEKITLSAHQFILVKANTWHELCLKENNSAMVNIEFVFEPCAQEETTIKKMVEETPEMKAFFHHNKPYLVLTDADERILSFLKQTVALADSKHAKNNTLTSMLVNMILLMMAKQYELEKEGKQPMVCNPILHKGLQLIHEQEEGIRVEELAQILEVHPTYLAFLFKEHLGVTPTQYMKKIKLKKAKSLLIEREDSIVQIAEFSGFNSQQYFIRAFKNQFGITPGEYRKNHKTI